MYGKVKVSSRKIFLQFAFNLQRLGALGQISSLFSLIKYI